MTGIAGIACPGKHAEVKRMMNAMGHRGRAAHSLFESGGATLGEVWRMQKSASHCSREGIVRDRAGVSRLAEAHAHDGHLSLRRDTLGVAPLYYGRDEAGALCFASEVKALLTVTRDVKEFPPAHEFDGVNLRQYSCLEKQSPLSDAPGAIARELRKRLDTAVDACIDNQVMGAWLSGGLDSSAIAAIARQKVETLHTFAGGLVGAPDLDHAHAVATYIQSEHHEIIVDLADMLAVLPQVIYHLESFDALLVRSSIVNHLVAKTASEYVPEVFSGEGADELFAGYEYLRSIDSEKLPDELVDITKRLHNTALQRVDRCASAHSLLAHVVFLDPQVVDYALRIPANLKLKDGVEKWILRQAMAGALPGEVLDRRKAKFWEGSGVVDLMAQHAEKAVSDSDFAKERTLPNGWLLSSKEELLYYRFFREHFGRVADLSWMGRTKGATTT